MHADAAPAAQLDLPDCEPGALPSAPPLLRHPLLRYPLLRLNAALKLAALPDLDRLVEGLSGILPRLKAEGANQYRHFRFEDTGAIRACIAFLRMDEALSDMPAETIALSLAAQAILLWSDRAFLDRSILARAGEAVILRPEVGNLIRAAYDPVLPPVAHDPTHALRLAARMQA